MIAHPPLSSMKNNKLNNIRKKNYTKKKTSSNESKKRVSEIEKLEMENQEMEQRLLELKQNLAKEKERRLKQGKSSFWQSGRKGVLFNHGNEVIYNKNLNQIKNKSSIYGIEFNNSSSRSLKNKEMFDPMRYLNLNSNNKNTLNLITTSTSQKNKNNSQDSNSKLNSTTTTKIIASRNKVLENRREKEYTEKQDIISNKPSKGLINFNRYFDNTTEQLNSINLSTHEDNMIIKSKYDEAMKQQSLVDNITTTTINSGINTSYNDESYSNNYLSINSSNNSYENEQNNNNTRSIDGEFNEEESHNSFIEALYMWRKERKEQTNTNVKPEKEIKSKVTFANDNNKNASETQTKALDNALNMDEIIKNMQNSKTSLSYMERLALYKYREQFKKDMEEEKQKPKSVNIKQDCKVVDIDEDEIDAEVEKCWEENNKESDEEKNIEEEIENNINNYVNQYKMKQLELYDYSKNKKHEPNIKNTKTSIYIEDSFSENEEEDNVIIEYNEISPIVDEPNENE